MASGVRRLWDLIVGLAILFLALLIIAKLENDGAQRFSGPLSVIDGDTLAAGSERLRIDGIDAPELDQACATSEGVDYACGEVARQTLRALVATGGWECSGTDRDRYARLLVICRRGSDDLGALLVSSGVAVAEGRYLAIESAARRAAKGIWSGAFERPADWRRQRTIEEAEPAGWVETLLPRWMLRWLEE